VLPRRLESEKKGWKSEKTGIAVAGGWEMEKVSNIF